MKWDITIDLVAIKMVIRECYEQFYYGHEFRISEEVDQFRKNHIPKF